MTVDIGGDHASAVHHQHSTFRLDLLDHSGVQGSVHCLHCFEYCLCELVKVLVSKRGCVCRGREAEGVLGPPPGLPINIAPQGQPRPTRSRATPKRHAHRRPEEPQHTEDYWAADVVARALEVGELFAATIRFNPHDPKQAFVTIKGLPADVCIAVRASVYCQ